MNRGSLGVRELNTALQRVLNPVRHGEPTVERFGWRFQTRDKVIQTENDYDKEVFNGNIGIVERIDPVEHEVAIRFDERLVKYDFGELDEVALAYAITIHKSQGSEFPAVVIPLGDPALHAVATQPDLHGITRGKRLLALIGQKKTLGIAVRNDRQQRRYSVLLTSLRSDRRGGAALPNRRPPMKSRVSVDGIAATRPDLKLITWGARLELAGYFRSRTGRINRARAPSTNRLHQARTQPGR
jgi:ATP-dependent exoDNAse (exonuclease V) alpha subunit